MTSGYSVGSPATHRQRSTFLIGLSNTNDTTQGWTLFSIDATLNGDTATSNWCDYPTLGVDAQAIYLTCNMFSFPSTTGSFQKPVEPRGWG